MSKNLVAQQYTRKITPIERLFTHSPFSLVTMVARLKGKVSEEQLTKAITKIQQRHINLRVQIKYDNDRTPWFTSEDVGETPIEVVPRENDNHWIKVHEAASKLPFEFEKKPAIRFILVRGASVSELIILSHHIICDGLSLAYLARDVMTHLGNPDLKVDVLPDPAPISEKNFPAGLSAKGIMKFFIKRINQKWADEKTTFEQEDYEALNDAYWQNFRHKLLSVELSEEETSRIVARSKDEKVTVNTALTAAFVGAQVKVQGEQPYHGSIGIAGSLRDRIPVPAGEGMGFYAGVVSPKCKYDPEKIFWENARAFHKKIKPQFTDKKLFSDFISWLHLDPTILEAINFKKLGGLVPKENPRHQKLSSFGKKDDVVLGILKRDKMETLERKIMGTAITNLTRMDFPRAYGSLELDRLIMHPGGAFPLANVNLVLGAVTCSGKLSLLLEYAEEAVDTQTMEKIRDEAMAYLLNN